MFLTWRFKDTNFTHLFQRQTNDRCFVKHKKNPVTPITVHWGSPLLILFFDFNSGGCLNLFTHFKLLSNTSLFSGIILSSGKSKCFVWNNPDDGRDGGLVSSPND